MRRQFGPPGKEEIPVLEYQMQVHEVNLKSLLFQCTRDVTSLLVAFQEELCR